MDNGRQIMGYSLYAIAAVILVAEQVLVWRMMRYIRQQYPQHQRRWFFWHVPNWKEIKNDPAYKSYQRRHMVMNVLLLGCVAGGSWLLGPDRIEFPLL